MAEKSLNEELMQLEIEEKKLRLEELRWQVEKRKQDKLSQATSHAQVESDLATYRNNIAANQAQCNHRKGGVGIEGLQGRGDDPDYAIVRHRFMDGKIGIMCLRCQKMWMPGDPDYKEAAQYPSKNTMSEGAQFRFEKVVI